MPPNDRHVAGIPEAAAGWDMAEKWKDRIEDLEPGEDQLGKLLARYGSNMKAIMLIVVALVLGLSGGAVRGAGEWLARNLADSNDSGPYTLVGWGLMITGAFAVSWGVLGLGRSFEIRKYGVRFSRRRDVTELSWEQVEDVQVHKTVVRTRYGTQVQWDVYIYGRSDTIHLAWSFLQLVPSVSELINVLKATSGREIELPPLY